MSSPTINERTVLLAPLAHLSLGTYTAAGAEASDLAEMGAINGLRVFYKISRGAYESDNSPDVIRSYRTKREAHVEFEVLEDNLDLLALLMGLGAGACVTTEHAAGPPLVLGKKVLSIGDLSADVPVQLRIRVEDQDIVDPKTGDVYDRATLNLWSVNLEPDLNVAIGVKTEKTKYKVKGVINRDSTVTTGDKLMKWTFEESA